MLQKVLKFANYAVAVLVKKIMLFCSNYAKNYASIIRQGLGKTSKRKGGVSQACLGKSTSVILDIHSMVN